MKEFSGIVHSDFRVDCTNEYSSLRWQKGWKHTGRWHEWTHPQCQTRNGRRRRPVIFPIRLIVPVQTAKCTLTLHNVSNLDFWQVMTTGVSSLPAGLGGCYLNAAMNWNSTFIQESWYIEWWRCRWWLMAMSMAMTMMTQTSAWGMCHLLSSSQCR